MQNASGIFTLLKTSEKFLSSYNIKEAKLDAEILLSCVLGIKRNKLFTMRSQTLTLEELEKYKSYLQRRSTREPVAYISGKTEFMGLEFEVNNNVLIPRQETEILAEEVNNQIKTNNCRHILDLCTGSGCIAVSVAYENDVLVTATDISDKAVKLAVNNAKINNVENKIKFLTGDMFEKIGSRKFDIIVSNPPYVTQEEFKNLEQELFFEPKKALIAKDCGLFFYRQIAQNAKKYLYKNSLVIIELNSNISKKIVELFEKHGFKKIKIIKDYAGLDRVLVLKNG